MLKNDIEYYLNNQLERRINRHKDFNGIISNHKTSRLHYGNCKLKNQFDYPNGFIKLKTNQIKVPTLCTTSSRLSENKLKLNTNNNHYGVLDTTQTNSRFTIKNMAPTQVTKSNSSISIINPIMKPNKSLSLDKHNKLDIKHLHKSPKEDSFVSKYNNVSNDKDPHLFSNSSSFVFENNRKKRPLLLKASKSSSNVSLKTKAKTKIDKCLHCFLNSKIDSKRVLINPHDCHSKFRQSKDINEILLEAKSEMKKCNFYKANDILKVAIGKGYFHSDLFYLFGEVKRLMKYYEEAEDYFLLSLKFKHHSYYIYFSLGILYQETSLLEHSNNYYKKFLEHCETADVHFQMAKNYAELKEYLDAADHFTKAIDKKPDCIEYYQFRSEIYKLIGLTQLANDDIKMINTIQKDE